MREIEQYLRSKQAVEDMATRIRDGSAPWVWSADLGGRGCCGWRAEARGAWQAVALWSCGGTTPEGSAYYRPDGERFIVTDLGEAVRALRMRTGDLSVGETVATMWAGTKLPEDAAGMHGDAFYVIVSAAVLPAAICHVMLSAYHVASLEVPT